MGLKENIENEPVTQLEIREAVTMSPTDTLGDTVSAMRKRDIGCAIVVDADRKPIGVVTESMLTELLSHGPLAISEPVETYMAERCPWVKESDPVSEMLDAMQLKNIRMLCVVDEQDRVVGVTGQRGLMEYVAEHFPGEVMVQRIGQSPYLSDREGA